MNNTTGEISSAPQRTGLLFYLVEGVAIILGNIIIILAFITSKQLRRIELHCVLNLAVADLLVGIGYFTAACRRLYILDYHLYEINVTPWYCMLTVPTMVFKVADIAAVLSVLALTLDRAVACLSVRYVKLTGIYNKWLLSSVWLLSLAWLVVVMGASHHYSIGRYCSLVCYTTMAYPRLYDLLHTAMVIAFGFISAMIYILICIPNLILKYAASRKVVVNNAVSKERRITIILFIVTMLTLLTQTVPLATIFYLTSCCHKSNVVKLYRSFFWVLAASNSGNNVIIYLVSMKDIREAVKLFPGIRRFRKITLSPTKSNPITLKKLTSKPNTSTLNRVQPMKAE